MSKHRPCKFSVARFHAVKVGFKRNRVSLPLNHTFPVHKFDQSPEIGKLPAETTLIKRESKVIGYVMRKNFLDHVGLKVPDPARTFFFSRYFSRTHQAVEKDLEIHFMVRHVH